MDIINSVEYSEIDNNIIVKGNIDLYDKDGNIIGSKPSIKGFNPLIKTDWESLESDENLSKYLVFWGGLEKPEEDHLI